RPFSRLGCASLQKNGKGIVKTFVEPQFAHRDSATPRAYPSPAADRGSAARAALQRLAEPPPTEKRRPPPGCFCASMVTPAAQYRCYFRRRRVVAKPTSGIIASAGSGTDAA